MEEKRDTHCLVLKPYDQVVVRCLLFNAMSKFLETTIRSLEEVNINEATSYSKVNITLAMFNRYNDFLDLLYTRDNWYKSTAKSKMFLIKPPMMSILKNAVHGYDKEKNYLAADDADTVNRKVYEVRVNIDETAKYLYTQEEIKQMQNEVSGG